MKQYINPGVAVSQQMATLLRSKGREFQWFKLDRELGVKSTGGGWAHKVYVLEQVRHGEGDAYPDGVQEPTGHLTNWKNVL